MGVASGYGCKEYRFPHITYPYSSCICFFLQQHPYFLFFFFNVFRSCSIMDEKSAQIVSTCDLGQSINQ